MKPPQTITVFAKFTDYGWIHLAPDEATGRAVAHLANEEAKRLGVHCGHFLPKAMILPMLFQQEKAGNGIKILVSFLYGVRELVLDKENPHHLVLVDFAGPLTTVPNESRFFVPHETNLQGFCGGGTLTFKPVAKK